MIDLPSQQSPNERAHGLLWSYLDDEQRACYEAHGQFYVTVERPPYANGRKRPVKHFLLRDGWEVYAVTAAGPTTLHCLGAFEAGYYGQEPLPREDSLLTQMLLLQTDYDQFRDIACASSLRNAGYWLPHRGIDWKLGFPGEIKEEV